jgi:hypothetical protein
VEVYNTISGSIQNYKWKCKILSVEVYNTISGSIQYYQYTILSVEYTILHSVYMYTVGATQLWFRVRVPFVDFLLNIQRNSSSITKDHSANPQSQCPPTSPAYTSAIRQFFSA